MMGARYLQRGIAANDLIGGRAGNARIRAKKVEGIAALGGKFADFPHPVGEGDAFRNVFSQQSGAQDDPGPITKHELGLIVQFAHPDMLGRQIQAVNVGMQDPRPAAAINVAGQFLVKIVNRD